MLLLLPDTWLRCLLATPPSPFKQGAKKITYAQFMTALSLIASVKKVAPQSLVDCVLHCGGPGVTSTLTSTPCADLVRMHDSH